MNIYEVIFWGSHGNRPNKDVIYLVRALDFRAAVDEVSNNASPTNHGGENFPLAHAVYEVGKDLSLHPEHQQRILQGPYTESAYTRGWKAWHRRIEGSEYTKEWQEEAASSERLRDKDELP